MRFPAKSLLSAIVVVMMMPLYAVHAAERYYNYQEEYFATIGLANGGNIDDGHGVVVAVIDDGVWQSHPDLAENIWNNARDTRANAFDDDGNGYADDFYGWNFVDNNYDATTKGSHGTEVASVIAAKINGEGIAGIAPGAQIMALTACDSTGCSEENVIKAMYYAVDNGADIINLSLGSSGYLGYDHTIDDAVQYAYEHDVVVVAAAGNGDVESAGSIGQNLSYIPASPVCNDVDGYNMVVGVGATDASWSNYGDCVDITAPGQEIAVAIVPADNNDNYYYTTSSGTSFSAPMVSAALAVLKSRKPTLKNYELIDRVITAAQNGVLNVSTTISASPLPAFSEVSSSASAGEAIEIKGVHLTGNATLLLQGSTGSVEIDASAVTVHDSQSMSVTIPSGTAVGTYTVAYKNTPDTKSSTFTITEASSATPDTSSDSTDEESGASASDTTSTGSDVSLLGGQYDETKRDTSLIQRLLGSILLQVNEHGEAWYVNPADSLRYYMKDGATAYEMMRSFGLGITDKDLATIPSAEDSAGIKAAKSVCSTNSVANRLKGKILLQVEQHGEAWYIDPTSCTRVYLKDGAAAYSVMRELGLGIANADLEKLPDGEVVKK